MISPTFRNNFWGTDTPVTTKRGCMPRVYFNNAAAPLVAKPVTSYYQQMLSYYSFHNEPNSISAHMERSYSMVRDMTLDYIDGESTLDTVIFTHSTTAAINLLSHIYHQMDDSQVIITTRMEHMANYMPFNTKFQTAVVKVTADGQIDLDHYEQLLKTNQGKVKLVAVTAGSNITGIIPPYYRMAELAHQYDAKIFLDAVQLAPHKPFSMKPHTDPQHIDFLSFDGHKCYTGQSGGVLIGPKDILNHYQSNTYGEGISEFISDELIVLKSAPYRYETGFPDFFGILSLGRALTFLKSVGLNAISEYETLLYNYLVMQLQLLDKVTVYGAETKDHLPIVSFTVDDIPYNMLGEFLGYQYGIALGCGTNGADLYVQDLLGLSNEQAYALYKDGLGPGMIRISLAAFNSVDDIKRLIDALTQITK